MSQFSVTSMISYVVAGQCYITQQATKLKSAKSIFNLLTSKATLYLNVRLFGSFRRVKLAGSSINWPNTFNVQFSTVVELIQNIAQI